MSDREIIIVDLDGTLANLDHRIHHVSGHKKDWKTFFAESHKDEPYEHILRIIRVLSGGFNIWVVSGRSDEVREQTEAWLKTHLICPYTLVMRKAGDYTPDDTLKISWLHDGTIPRHKIFCAFDDRDRVVKAWRAEGIICLQVRPGDF